MPEIHFPPGYPCLLALAGAIDAASLARAGFLQAALMALNVLLLALVASRVARVPRAGAIAAWLLVAATPILDVHAMVWSEGAFIALVLAAIGLAAAAFDTGRFGLWAGCGLCVGLGILTRYAGVTLVPAFLFAIARHREWPRRPRVQAAGVLAAAAIVLPAAWLLRNTWLGGAPTDRPLAFHALDAGHLRILAPLALALAAAAFIARRRSAGIRLAVAAAVSYVSLVTLSIVAFDADTPLDTRILVPLLPLALVTIAPWLVSPPPWARVVLATSIAAGVAHGIVVADGRGLEGDGFNTRYWRDALTESGLRPGTAPVYTNVPEWVAFQTGREVRDIPARHSRVSLRAREEYSAELEAMCDALEAGAVLVYFEGVTWRWEIPPEDEISAACHRPATASSDGLHAAALREGGWRTPKPTAASGHRYARPGVGG